MPNHRVVTLDELTQYLHLPEKAVAKQLGICLTSLKKLCRQHGITRWPYRKLKSLDKKIAKAETGAGAGIEDPALLKLKAEELKKEKMAVAFTYGLKEKADGGLEFDAQAVAAANGEGGAKLKPKKAKAAAAKKDASEGSSRSGIPTPPDEEAGSPLDEDLFDSDALGHPSHGMMNENGMNPTDEWVAPDVDVIDEVGDVAHHRHGHGDEADEDHDAVEKVDLLADDKEDKLSSVKMALSPPLDRSSLSQDASSPISSRVSKASPAQAPDSDLNMASSLASSLASSVNTPSTPDSDEPLKEAHKASSSSLLLSSLLSSSSSLLSSSSSCAPSVQPKFDVDAPADLSADLMQSDFFSAIPHAHEEEHHDDTAVVCVVDRDDASPEGRHSSLATVAHHVTVPDLCDIPSHHRISTEMTIDAAWGEDPTQAWFTSDTPDKKKGDEALTLQTKDLGRMTRSAMQTSPAQSSPAGKIKSR